MAKQLQFGAHDLRIIRLALLDAIDDRDSLIDSYSGYSHDKNSRDAIRHAKNRIAGYRRLRAMIEEHLFGRKVTTAAEDLDIAIASGAAIMIDPRCLSFSLSQRSRVRILHGWAFREHKPEDVEKIKKFIASGEPHELQGTIYYDAAVSEANQQFSANQTLESPSGEKKPE